MKEVAVARERSGRPHAEEPEVDADTAGATETDEDLDAVDGRSALWSDLRIDPVEIALPRGVGYTLRAYRMSNEVAPPEIDRTEDDEFPVVRRRSDEVGPEFDDDPDSEEEYRGEDDELGEVDFDQESDEAEDDAEDESDDEDETEEAAEPEPEEIPVFLANRGKLLLFRSVEGLVEFVRSDTAHELSQLDTWPDLVEQIRVEDVVPLPDDTYELDLVVDNLRGGADAWDPALLIKAGEAARDIAFALRLEPVMTALAPGSPLDDLDEALRAAEAGGMSGFLARRRLKRIRAEQAALGWRTIIGKISAATDWRD
ncbi:MAG TPA: DNA primase [Micromonosporaceae bacterium]